MIQLQYKITGDANHNDIAPVCITVAIADIVLTEEQKPQPVPGLTYTGQEQVLVTAPKTPLEGYTVQYSTDEGANWSAEIPKAKDIGTYTVKVRYVKVSDSGSIIEGTDISVAIDKAAPVIITPESKVSLIYTGSEIELIKAVSVTGGTVEYALGTDGENAPTDENAWSANIPKAKDVGTYYVWYRVKGDNEHSDTAPAAITVTISKTEIKGISLRAVNGMTMVPGASQKIEVKLTPADATEDMLTWTSSDEAIATVKDGLVTVKKDSEIDWKGSLYADVKITASADKVSSSLTIRVQRSLYEVEEINIDPLSVKKDAKVGDTFRLTAQTVPAEATDQTVKWTSSDPKVAEVGPTGIVKVTGYGQTTITVTTDNGKTASFTLVINKISVTAISINTAGGDDYLVVGKTVDLSGFISFAPENATETGVTWTTSDPEVATVDKDGKVTGIKSGRVKITVTSTDDPSKTASVEYIVFDSDDSLYVEFAAGTDYDYTGKAVTPLVNVYYRGNILMRDTDYSVAYRNNRNANNAANAYKAPKVIVTGKTVAAKAEAAFRITPIDIGDEVKLYHNT